MNNTTFYDKAITPMKAEIDRLNAFTDALDRDPAAKQEQIAEYKCAKYRYAGISNISCRLYFSNKFGYKYNENYFQTPDVWEIVKDDPAFFEAVDNAPEDEKRIVAMYLGILAYADHLISEKEALLSTATDWERIELEEYLGGYRFARKCITDAWNEEV